MSKPIAIDLFCGLPSEGHLWYATIWHTKRVLSLSGSGKRSINQLIAGYGPPQRRNLAMGNLLSRKVRHPSGRIASLMNCKLGQFRQECRFFIIATTQPASVLTIYSSGRRLTTFETCNRKVAGIISLETKAVSATQTLSYPMSRSRPCYAILRKAGGQ